jgi:fucose permease
MALLGFAVTPFWPAMLGLGLVAGLAGGAVDAGLNAYGAAHFSARTLNWLHAFFGLGTTVGPLVVTAVLGAGHVWRWAYVIVGTAQVLLALAFHTTRRRWLEAGGLAPDRVLSVQAARSRDTLRRPIVWLGMLTFFFYTGVEIVAAQWSYSLLTLGRGVPAATAGLMVSLYWGSLMAGRVLFGLVADRVPLTRTLRFCIIGSIAGALLFWLEPTRLLSFAGLMAMGFFLAPIFASMISLTPGRVGRAHADSAIGFQIAAAALGGAALTALVGVAARTGGLEVIGAAIAIFAVLLLVLFEAFMRAGKPAAS